MNAAPGDPPVLHRLAARYGQGVADGTEDYLDVVARLCIIATWHPRVAPLQIEAVMARVERTLCDAANADERAAERDIREAITPLLARRVPSSIIRSRAYEVAAARLLRPDVDAIVQVVLGEHIAAKAARCG